MVEGDIAATAAAGQGGPLVSVVVPAYNHERYAGECLRSIGAQSWGRLELIVIDDGSRDGTLAEVERTVAGLPGRFERVAIQTQQNSGISATINRGLALARGDLIKVIASDDVMFPDQIARLADVLLTDPELGVAHGDGYLFVDDGTDSRCFDGMTRFSSVWPFSRGDVFRTFIERPWYWNGVDAGLLFRRSALDAVGPLDEALAREDVDWMLRLLRLYPVGFVAEPLGFKRMHPTNQCKVGPFDLGTEQTIRKYQAVDGFFADEAERQTLIDSLSHWASIFDDVVARGAGRRLIGWGAGRCLERGLLRQALPLDYVVDRDPAKQGTRVGDIPVVAPERLRSEPREEVLVLVFSQFFRDIWPTLESWGYVVGESCY